MIHQIYLCFNYNYNPIKNNSHHIYLNNYYFDVLLPTLINDRYVFQANDTICTINTLYCCGIIVKLTVCTAGQI